jgi:hypothetical protein
MRFLMYYFNYDPPGKAVRLFHHLPATCRERLAHLDYSKAERVCPQRMPIGRLVREAVETFANTRLG